VSDATHLHTQIKKQMAILGFPSRQDLKMDYGRTRQNMTKIKSNKPFCSYSEL